MKKEFQFEEVQKALDEAELTYEEMFEAIKDSYHGNTKGMSAEDVSDKVRKFCLNMVGLTPETAKNPTAYKRAMRKKGDYVFDLLEDTISLAINDSLANHPLNQFVEERTIGVNDDLQFWIDDETDLVVGKVAGAHHDMLIQRLGEGSYVTPSMDTYGIKVGGDLRMYMLGKLDLAKLITKVGEAFADKYATMVCESVYNVGAKLPAKADLAKVVQLSGAGFNKETARTEIEDLIHMVSDLNGNKEVMVFGFRKTMSTLTNLYDVDWLSNEMKNEKYHNGRLGTFGSATLYEIPNVYKKNATGGLDKRLKEDKLLIVPVNGDKWIKRLKQDTPDIYRINEEGGTMDDTISYEIKERAGIATVLGQYMGEITVTTA